MMDAMKVRFLAASILAALSCAAWADEQAFTSRSTELKERGAAEAKTVATLPEKTAVKVLERGAGGWTRVDAGGQVGWVRVFHLRFPTTVESSSSGGFLSGVTSILGGGKAPQATVATTGIRGLSPDDLKNANPDHAALAKMQSYRANKDGAERFARDGKLAGADVGYVEEKRR
jgi:hypothetical protein